MKKTMTFVIAAVFSAMLGVTAFAAATFSECWFEDASGQWHVRNRDGSTVTNAWFCDDAVPANGKDVWYLLDASGNMISAGLVQDGTGNYYSLETDHNGYYGMLRYKSGTYDGILLDLESSHAGAFAAIRNADGIEALKARYGVTQVSIDNSNIVYSSGIVGKNSGSASVGSSGAVSQAATAGGKATSVDDAVAAFKAQHITEGMSEFEREMQIIMYAISRR